jgi:hypothetical protein
MEKIESLNKRLADYFGLDTESGLPIFRIVWGPDQLEKKKVDRTPEGIHLIYPEVREVKKYQGYTDSYMLERLVIVEGINAEEIPEFKKSYEPIWSYVDKDNNPLPPIWAATKLVIDVLYAAMGKSSLNKYVESEENLTQEGREARIDKITEELFGNETDTGDALAHGQAIVVPRNYEKGMK